MNILLISKNKYNRYLNKYNITRCINYDQAISNIKLNYDAIIIDGLIDINILKLLNNYPDPSYLTKTIIIDNNYYCYNMLNNQYQIFAVIDNNNINNIEYYIEEINRRNSFYNIDKANIYDEISNMLKKLGISPDKDGFHYLRKAIYESFKNPLINNNYNKIYDILENTFSISKKDIERSIRYSISVGFTKSDYEYSEKLFSNILSYEQTQPKNSEFIAVMVEELLKNHHKTLY